MSFYDIDENSSLTRAAQLLAKDPDGSKEREKVSAHSSGPVGDHELLARSLEFPNKFDATGGLNDSFFNDAFKNGASVQRLLDGWDVESESVHRRFEARAESRRQGCEKRKPAPDNLYIGSFHVTAGELREVQLDSEILRRVRVYDAAHSSDDPKHADILANDGGLTKTMRHMLRVRLMILVQKRGLFVSPHLSPEGVKRAEGTGCTLNFSSGLQALSE